MIDPGHGGTDTGATVGQAKEAEIALKVSSLVARKLRANSSFFVALTRDRDQQISLPQRVKAADEFGAELFLSIHANASPDRRAKGVEFYFQNQLPVDEESLYLAAIENRSEKGLNTDTEELNHGKTASDVSSIIQDLQRQNRFRKSFHLSQTLAATWGGLDHIDTHSIRQAPFYVVSRNERPAVLIELGFITNSRDAERMIRPEYQEQVAEKIYLALLAHTRASQSSAP